LNRPRLDLTKSFLQIWDVLKLVYYTHFDSNFVWMLGDNSNIVIVWWFLNSWGHWFLECCSSDRHERHVPWSLDFQPSNYMSIFMIQSFCIWESESMECVKGWKCFQYIRRRKFFWTSNIFSWKCQFFEMRKISHHGIYRMSTVQKPIFIVLILN